MRNRAQVEAYLADWLAFGRTSREAQAKNPPPVVLRLCQRQAEQQTVP